MVDLQACTGNFLTTKNTKSTKVKQEEPKTHWHLIVSGVEQSRAMK